MEVTPFRRALTVAAGWLAHPFAFVVTTVFGVAWMVTQGITWDDTAALTTVYMTLFILRADRRDTAALHAKLDELLRASAGAREGFSDVDKKEPEEIEHIREQQNNAAR
jgi:low affinity Fe/Cu permease